MEEEKIKEIIAQREKLFEEIKELLTPIILKSVKNAETEKRVQKILGTLRRSRGIIRVISRGFQENNQKIRR